MILLEYLSMTRTYIAVLVFMMINALIFGVGAIAVLSIPALSAHASLLLPIVVVLSFVISPFISWLLAPTLRARWQRDHMHPNENR